MTTVKHLGVWDQNSLYPPAAASLVLTSPQVKRAEAAIGRVRERGAGNITVWAGAPGLGKTTTAWILCRIIHERAAIHAAYLDAPTPRNSRTDERTVLRSILTGGIGRIPDTMFRGRTDTELADMILRALFTQGVRLLVLDEAGRLGFSGLEAVGVLVDRANALNEAFHVVLVGMERLPATLRSNARMRSRVGAWEQFAPLAVGEFGRVLNDAYPQMFAAMAPEEREMATATLHLESGGCLREVLGVLGEAQLLQEEGRFRVSVADLLALLKVQRATAERLTSLPTLVAQEPRRAHQAAFPRATA